ncbi:MAG: MATE family efflux transporter, partial [Treponemataceae bacterium]|nr:MATE family efflux transporter [Treponemataceae bacterium]
MKTVSRPQHLLFSSADLRKLIIPLVLEQLLAMTVGMADTMMVSSVGEAAISGVSLIDMVNVLIFGVMAALATGGAVVTSQYLGAKRDDAARNSARQLMATVLVAGVVIGVLSIVLRKPLIRLLFGRIEDDVFQNAVIYLVISAVSFPFLALYNACAALFRSMGNASITFKVSVIINVINVAGNALCIFVFRMGVAGVAVPSLVSRLVGALILYVLLKNPDQQVYLEGGSFSWDLSEVRKILHIGIPSGIENGLFQLGRVMVVSIISGFGTVQIAANGVANNLDSMGVLIGSAMNLAIITVIGQCVGARDEDQIRYYTRRMVGEAHVGTAVVVLGLTLGLDWILALYGLGPETTALAKRLVLIHNTCAVFMWPLSFVLPNMLRACNDVKFTMWASVLSMFLFRVVFGWLLGEQLGMGAVGVWYAMLLDWICRIICFVGRYLRGSWKRTARLA